MKLIQESDIFKHIFGLVDRYAWNNFLQNKVIELSEEILEKCNNYEMKVSFVEKSGVPKLLTDMSKNPNYIMESSSQTRIGYMGLVIAISNKLIEKADIDEDDKDWKDFVAGELHRSNENNNKTLFKDELNKDSDTFS